MSPEQARGSTRNLDRRTDVYSLGAMLYELLCGSPPFEAENEVDLLLSVLHTEPTPLRQKEPSLPIDLEVITHKCLRKEPQYRYESAQALADDLGCYLRCEPILARPATTLYKLRRLASRHRTKFAVGSVVFAAFVVLLGMWGQARAQRLRQAARAAEQERLAAQLGQSVTEMKLFLRVAYSLPPHDLQRDYDIVTKKLSKLEEQLKETDSFLHGTIESALGQGYLALEKNELATLHLQRALDLGENSGSTYLALGESLVRTFESRKRQVIKQYEKDQVQPHIDRLKKEFWPRARQAFEAARQVDSTDKHYIEALLLRYSDTPKLTEAIQLLRLAEAETPWKLEPVKERLEMIGYLSSEAMAKQHMTPEKEAADVQHSIEEAIAMARSYPPFYFLHAAWLEDQLRSLVQSAEPSPLAEPTYRTGMEYAKTLRTILPNDGRSADALAAFPVGYIAVANFNMQDISEPVKLAKQYLADAKKRLPERAETYLAENRFYQTLTEQAAGKGNLEDSLRYSQAQVSAAQRAVAIEPGNVTMLSRLAIGQMSLAIQKRTLHQDFQSDLAQATQNAKRCVELVPGYLNLQNTLGAILVTGAELMFSIGKDPGAPNQQGRRLLEQVLVEQPDFLFSHINLFESYLVEIQYLNSIGGDTKEVISLALKRAAESQKRFPASVMVQYHVANVLALEVKELAKTTDATPLIQAFIQRIQGPEFAQFTETIRHNLFSQVELVRIAQQVQKGNSPEASVARVLAWTKLENMPNDGDLLLRKFWRAQALRFFAEYLISTGRKPAQSPNGIRLTTDAVVDEAISLFQQVPVGPQVMTLESEPALARLWALKAMWAKGDSGVTALARKNVQALNRPDLAGQFDSYLAQGIRGLGQKN